MATSTRPFGRQVAENAEEPEGWGGEALRLQLAAASSPGPSGHPGPKRARWQLCLAATTSVTSCFGPFHAASSFQKWAKQKSLDISLLLAFIAAVAAFFVALSFTTAAMASGVAALAAIAAVGLQQALLQAAAKPAVQGVTCIAVFACLLFGVLFRSGAGTANFVGVVPAGAAGGCFNLIGGQEGDAASGSAAADAEMHAHTWSTLVWAAGYNSCPKIAAAVLSAAQWQRPPPPSTTANRYSWPRALCLVLSRTAP